MTGFDLSQIRDEDLVHLVGIGGAGMSAIATVLMEMGCRVAGSDLKDSPNIARLRKMGAVVGIGHRPENLAGATVVIRSSAIPAHNTELLEAARVGVQVITRAQMLSAIMKTKKGIAVAGTHGKTTTSSMLTQMLRGCRADPAFLIGGELNEIGGNAHYGEGEYLVAEADESDGSLLCLPPDHAVLTNVELDHPDYFESIEHTADVFREFLEALPPDGIAVVCGDERWAREVGAVSRGEAGNLFFYGKGEDNQYRFEDESWSADSCSYRALYSGEQLGVVKTGVPGLHNIYNSLAALAMVHQLGFDVDAAIEGFRLFSGVRRRFELIGRRNGIEVIDDYAHHPSEVRAVVELAVSLSPGRVVVVFQPHRYSRTRELSAEFGGSFSGSDLVVVTDVYGAGEEPEPGVTGRLVADGISERSPGVKVQYAPSRTELAASVVPLLREGDLVITMGAGDVTQCAREILELMAAEER